MAIRPSRRNFLRAAPLAAAASLSDPLLFAASAPAGSPEPFQFFPAAKLEDAAKALHAAPGNDNLFTPKALPFTVVMTVEEKKTAPDFEWHEGRDHILQIVEGSTLYEVGGAPRGGHLKGLGEWLAPASEGSTVLTLNKGDLLVIPRGTPHKRTTEKSVTFYLISTTGSPPA